MAWNGIVNQHFTPEEFQDYVAGLTFEWKPRFVVLHNTDAPDLSRYLQYQTQDKPVSDTQWLKNLEHRYKNLQRWRGGPHLFIVPKSCGILVFNPLTIPGTHSPSWNNVSWGVEMVGNYDREKFDEGPGAMVRENAVSAIATLMKKGGLNSFNLRLHREDPKTAHRNCPGKNVSKADMVSRIEKAMKHKGD